MHYIDIGMDVHGDERPVIGGQIILSSPCGPCMTCMGFLTAEKLAAEAARYGSAGGRPQVVWPNGALASTAVGLAVDLVTGWPHVQLDASDFMPNGYIKVREGKTKSAERILPLTPRAKEVLLSLRTDPRRKRWVFPGLGNSGHLISIQKSHRRALRKAGLDQFPFYCWRHTFGTRCAESGMDRHTLAKLMGHSSPRITEKYYIHVTEPHISSGFQRFMAYQAKRLTGSAAITASQ